METHGAVVLEGRVDKDVVAQAYEELTSGRMAGGQNVRFGPPTQLWRSPLDAARESAATRLAEDPLLMAVAEHLRPLHGQGSARCIANEVRLLILPPGCEAGGLHRDVTDTSKVPLERPLQWGLNAIWPVGAFARENGATRFVPGSHSGTKPQGFWSGDHPDAEAAARAAVMAVGSVVLYYASVLHGSGENRAQAQRTGINFNYAFVDSEGQRPAGWGW